MKKCRYCAEDIQDEAVLCRFCGRPQRGVEEPGRRALLYGGAAAVLVAAVVAGLLLSGGLHRRPPLGPGGIDTAAAHDSVRPLRDSFPLFADLPEQEQPEEPAPPPPPPPAPPPAPPATGEVAAFADQKLGAGGYVYYGMEVDDTRPCRLRGRVEATAGGSHDVDVMLLDEDGWANFRYNRGFEPLFQRRRTAAATLDVPLPGPGKYWFVISNRFSAFTSKLVTADNVHWICSDELEPVATDSTADN